MRQLLGSKRFLFAASIFLVSTISFALGYLTARETNRVPLVIEQCSEENQ